MMEEMMKRCCGADGRPDFERMKRFMEACGMSGFSDEHIAMMKRFCGGEGPPDFEEIKGFMEGCGCSPPAEAAAGESAEGRRD